MIRALHSQLPLLVFVKVGRAAALPRQNYANGEMGTVVHNGGFAPGVPLPPCVAPYGRSAVVGASGGGGGTGGDGSERDLHAEHTSLMSKREPGWVGVPDTVDGVGERPKEPVT